MDPIASIADDFDRFIDVEWSDEDAPREVTVALRVAFHAGAASILRSVDRISRTADSPAMGLLELERLHEEVRRFAMVRVSEVIGEALGELDGGMVMVRIRPAS
jgi:hypothetical protein